MQNMCPSFDRIARPSPIDAITHKMPALQDKQSQTPHRPPADKSSSAQSTMTNGGSKVRQMSHRRGSCEPLHRRQAQCPPSPQPRPPGRQTCHPPSGGQTRFAPRRRGHGTVIRGAEGGRCWAPEPVQMRRLRRWWGTKVEMRGCGARGSGEKDMTRMQMH